MEPLSPGCIIKLFEVPFIKASICSDDNIYIYIYIYVCVCVWNNKELALLGENDMRIRPNEVHFSTTITKFSS